MEINQFRSFALTFSLALVACTVAAQKGADLILINGRIFTAEPSNPKAEAVAISGNTIAAVGTSATIAQLAGPNTIRIDLQGRVVIPGINDAHTEQAPSPESFTLSITPESTIADVGLALISAADESPAVMWLTGTIGNQVLTDPALTAAALEKTAPGRKVMLVSSSAHAFIFSAAALDAMKIRRDTSNPVGGWFERAASGDLVGKAFEYAGWNAERKVADSVSDDEAVTALRDFASEAVRHGITSVQNVSRLPFARYEKNVRHADVPLRIRMIRFPGTDANGRDRAEGSNFAPRDRERKYSIVSGTEWILDGPSGQLNFRPSEASQMLAESLAANDQILFSVENERTAAAVFDAMKAIPGVDWKSKRVRFENGYSLTANLIPIAKSLGIVVIQDPASGSVRLKSLLSAGIPVALRSHGEINPFRDIMLASEKITREEAVEAYTRGSAFAEFSENEKGTIAAGKLADLAVLSQDIFTVRTSALPNTESLLTILDGKIVYDAGVLDVPGRRRPRSKLPLE
jgi:predicted amidohydrolase YtcJ